MCRTDAAVGPVGVVVVLRHAGVAEEAVARPHRLLGLQTKINVCHGRHAVCADGTRSYECVKLTMQDVQNILGSRQPASANTSTF